VFLRTALDFLILLDGHLASKIYNGQLVTFEANSEVHEIHTNRKHFQVAFK
jgi:hypothetical protein